MSLEIFFDLSTFKHSLSKLVYTQLIDLFASLPQVSEGTITIPLSILGKTEGER